MISAQTYLEHVKAAGERIARVAEGHLDEPVPSCPGNTVGSLLIHTQAFCMRVADGLAGADTDFNRLDSDVLAGHRREHKRLVRELGAKDPDQGMWSWGSDQHARFWFRRSAQELAVHRWDFESAVGDHLPCDPTLAADGVDEFLREFGKSPPPEMGFKGAAELLDAPDRTFLFEVTDLPTAWTVRSAGDHFEIASRGDTADVTARGPASDLLLFLWGRVPPSALEVSGDASLLDRWQERVKI